MNLPGPGATLSLGQRLEALGLALPEHTSLLAVSKGHPAALIREAAALGQRSFGESRVQEAISKQAELGDLAPLDWHFIGRLQANKVRQVLRHFGTIHSVDSLELAQRLARIASEEGLSPRVLFQVKCRPDPSKTGFDPERLCQQWSELRSLQPLQPVGLMTIAPMGCNQQERLALFHDCSRLADQLDLPERSMGMSGDWPEAVAAGSTWVRIGSGVFGQRATLQG